MDNRITKRRLSDFLAYEWILIIIAIVASIIVWELIYSVSAVRLTVGQQFKYYFDQSVSSSGSSQFYNLLIDDDTFSYDVLELNTETLTADYNVLSVRLSIYEGDVIITDAKEAAEDAEDKTVRAKTLVDNSYGEKSECGMYDYQKLLSDAKAYLLGFMKTEVISIDNIDEAKVEAHFRERMKKDNRFRSEEQKIEGIKLEVGRIKKLAKEVLDFEKLMALGDEYFFTYRKYEQTLSSMSDDDRNKSAYQDAYDKQQTLRYGLRVGKLTGGEKNPSTYFKMQGADTADDVVIMIFDFKSQQPDLQYECISFINTIVRACSNIYSA